VLSTAYVLKEQVLGAIEMRHANEQAYQVALANWQSATANPEEHSRWQQFYANALRDALRKANNRRQETLGQMTQDDWGGVVTREMQADMWYAKPSPGEDALIVQVSGENMLLSSRNGKSHSPKVSAVVG
jgi:hypothetical protein